MPKTKLELKVDNRPKVFSIKTYNRKSWDIIEDPKNKYRGLICIKKSTKEEFHFSIDIDRTSFRPEFTCIYIDGKGKSVLLYRSEPSEHVKKFWNDLLDECWKKNNYYKDQLRDKVLSEWNFNWGKE